MNKYTEAIQGDDVVILCDGIPMGVGEILDALNAATPPEAVAQDAALGRAIQRASGELPEGFTICIDLENGAGSVELQDENCETLRSDESEPLSVQINDLIDEAIKSAAEEKDYE